MGSRAGAELLFCHSPGPRALFRGRRAAWATSPSSLRTVATTPISQAAQAQPKEEESHTPPAPTFRIRKVSRPSEGEASYDSPSSISSRNSRSPPQSNSRDQTNRAIDNLFGSFGSSNSSNDGNRGSIFAPRRNAPAATPEENAARGKHVFGAPFSRPNPQLGRRKLLDFDSMMLPTTNLPPLDSGTSPARAPVQTPAERQREEAAKNYPRLTPSYGRTVTLDDDKGRDFVRGVAMLGTLLSRNKVARDYVRQKFHERPGLKRKRLKSQRWRARFKKGFDHVTARVTELTRKGW